MSSQWWWLSVLSDFSIIVNSLHLLTCCDQRRFLVMGVLPFLTICFFNYKIYVVVSKRRRAGRRQKEDNLSFVLMTIVASFLLCNCPRIFLNMHEITVILEIYECRSVLAQMNARCKSMTVANSLSSKSCWVPSYIWSRLPYQQHISCSSNVTNTITTDYWGPSSWCPIPLLLITEDHLHDVQYHYY